MRLRRVFGRIGQQYGSASLKDTEEICHELAWFCDRFPLETSDEDFEHLCERGDDYTARVADFSALLTGKLDPRRFKLAVEPREYQRVAAELFLRSPGLLVADEVGLGKTCIAIAGLTEPATRPALVVTLTHLPKQWQKEIAKFAPSLTTHIITKGTPYEVETPDIFLINYHKLAGWCETLRGAVRTVVFDEVQELRRGASQKTKAAELISRETDFRIGLSATPIYNYGGEIYNVMQALCPDALGTRSEFMKEWCHDGTRYGDDKASITDPKAFGQYMRDQGIMIRRTREDVARELPALSKVPYHVNADPDALDEIADSVAELAKIILDEEGSGFDKMEASAELSWKLRQATGIAKAPYVADFVKLLVESGEKVLVYAWHREVYSVLRAKLKNYKPSMYTGSESPAKKEKEKAAFIDGDSKVLLMSLRAGAGLDGLQFVTSTVVFAELDWSPGVHHQCEGRVHRDGQTRPVVAYYLITDSGSDPVVADALGVKRTQVQGIINPDAELVEKIETDRDGIKKLAKAYLAQRSK